MKDRDYIIVNVGHGSRFECRRCGEHYQPTYPMPIPIMTSSTRAFTKIHATCKLKPEGLHCTLCGKTGHNPRLCPTTFAKQTLQQWRHGPDTGMSSITIWKTLRNGQPPEATDSEFGVPHDPDDFGRCSRLLAIFPEGREAITLLGQHHRVWLPFANFWEELEALYQEEAPSGNAPKLWARMRELAGLAPPRTKTATKTATRATR